MRGFVLAALVMVSSAWGQSVRDGAVGSRGAFDASSAAMSASRAEFGRDWQLASEGIKARTEQESRLTPEGRETARQLRAEEVRQWATEQRERIAMLERDKRLAVARHDTRRIERIEPELSALKRLKTPKGSEGMEVVQVGESKWIVNTAAFVAAPGDYTRRFTQLGVPIPRSPTGLPRGFEMEGSR